MIPMLQQPDAPAQAPGTPLADAMRAALTERAQNVERYLKRLDRKQGRNTRNVHQLRVATRRMGAALFVFKDYLNNRGRRRLAKAARRLRRAAGALRDLDVRRDLLEQRFDGTSNAGAEQHSKIAAPLRRGLAQERRKLDRKLKKNVSAWRKRFRMAAGDLLARLARKKTMNRLAGATLEDAAQAVLRARLEQFAAASAANLSDFDALHALRVAAKRLRYALEACAPAYPSAASEDLIQRLRDMQDALGEINDLRNLRQTPAHQPDSARFNDSGSKQESAAERNNAARHMTIAVQDENLREFIRGIDAELRERQRRFLSQWRQRHDDLQRRFNALLGGGNAGDEGFA